MYVAVALVFRIKKLDVFRLTKSSLTWSVEAEFPGDNMAYTYY